MLVSRLFLTPMIRGVQFYQKRYTQSFSPETPYKTFHLLFSFNASLQNIREMMVYIERKKKKENNKVKMNMICSEKEKTKRKQR